MILRRHARQDLRRTAPHTRCPLRPRASTQQMMSLYSYGVAGGGGGGSPPSMGNSKKKQGGGTTVGITTTGGTGSVLVVMLSTNTLSSATVTDNMSNTWPAASFNISCGLNELMVFMLVAGTGGAGHTVTISGSGGADIIFFFEVLGTATSSPVDTACTATVPDDTSPYTVSTAAANSVANSMVLVFCNVDTGGNPINYTPATGYTLITDLQEVDNNTYVGGAAHYKTVTSSATQSVTWTITGSPTAALGIMVIKGT